MCGNDARANPLRRSEQIMWPDRRILDLLKTEFPIVLAPMAGVMDADLAIAAAEGGALGSLPCDVGAINVAGGSHVKELDAVSISADNPTHATTTTNGRNARIEGEGAHPMFAECPGH